mmetsp:Transcript_32968/g.80157  ORF Transcript_32968/g.80157 Transcript_32968/m.80157 type:complete len:378 (+) Transcript_32968:261-1394(+)
MDAQHGAIVHMPPANGPFGVLVNQELFLLLAGGGLDGKVASVALPWRLGAKPGLRPRPDRHRRRQRSRGNPLASGRPLRTVWEAERDLQVEPQPFEVALHALHVVVDRPDLERPPVGGEDARLAPAVAGGGRANYADLAERGDRPGVRAADDRDRLLVVVAQVEVAGEPADDPPVRAGGAVEEAPPRGPGGVVEPRARVPDVDRVQHAQARAHRGRVRGDDDAPALLEGVGREDRLEPLHLPVADADLVGGEGVGAEALGRQADEEDPRGDLGRELAPLALDAEHAAPAVEVLPVGRKLVHPLEVVVAGHDRQRQAEAVEVVPRVLEGGRRPRGAVRAQVAEGEHATGSGGRADLWVLEEVQQLAACLVVSFHVVRV